MRIALCLAFLVSCLAGPATAAERELTGKVEAKAIKKLRFEGHVGSFELRGTDGDEIKWTLRLEPDDGGWFKSAKQAQRAVDEAKVRAVAAGDAWELETDLPSGADEDDVKEHWIVEVPARLALAFEARVGEATVEGVAGGVEAELNVGDLRIEVPRGAIDARVNVGELRITSGTKSPGRVRLEANVGDVDLKIQGKHIEADRSFAIGGGVSASNGGTDDISARVNVGDVRVHI